MKLRIITKSFIFFLIKHYVIYVYSNRLKSTENEEELIKWKAKIINSFVSCKDAK